MREESRRSVNSRNVLATTQFVNARATTEKSSSNADTSHLHSRREESRRSVNSRNEAEHDTIEVIDILYYDKKFNTLYNNQYLFVSQEHLQAENIQPTNDDVHMEEAEQPNHDSPSPSDDSGPEEEEEEEEVASSVHSQQLQDPNSTPPSDDSGPEEEEEEDPTFRDLFHSFSKKWAHTQLTHHVSLSAANSFWNTTMEFLPTILELKHLEGNESKIPQYMQVKTLH